MRMKKSFLVLFLIAIIFASSCKKEKLYSFSRPYYVTSFVTQFLYELRTAAYKDTLYVKDGEGVLTAYFAIIQGEFAHVQDTIVQYGHVWSTSVKKPKINPEDTSTFSRYYNWPIDTLGTFTSRILLYPETTFWVRSYVITSQGDTGYNQQVYCETSLPPIDEWFFAGIVPNISSNVREGAISLTFVNPETNYEVGLIGCGNDGLQAFADFWKYDQNTGQWDYLPGLLTKPRTEAVAFCIITYDEFGRKQTNLYVGGGVDMAGNVLKDFYKYSFMSAKWQQIDDFPRGIKSGVAFTIHDKAYVGLGTTQLSDKGDFYMFDPVLDENYQNPWVPVPGLGNDQLANARRDAVAFVVDDVGFVGTGMHVTDANDTIYYNDLWAFYPGDIANDSKWLARENVPGYSSGRAQAVAFEVDNQGYIGLGTDGNIVFKDFYRFDPYTNQWFYIKDFKMGPDYGGQTQRTVNAFGFGIKKKGYVGGGFYGFEYDPPFSNELWIYRPW